jgi:hypothetical protein
MLQGGLFDGLLKLLQHSVAIRGHPEAGLVVAPRLARPRGPLGLFQLRHRLPLSGSVISSPG